MVRPIKLYWKETKHVLRYLRGTTKYGLWYKQIDGVKLQSFKGIPLDRKSTSGGIFSIRSAIVSLYNRKYREIALSLVKAEYMVAS